MNQEEKLIDYLYGEMTPKERQAFEEELAQNPALQKELEALQGSRAFLADLPDVKVPTSIVAIQPKRTKWQRWLLPASVAASILFLLQILNFQITRTNNGLAFSFGDKADYQDSLAKQNTSKYISLADVQVLLEARENAHRRDLLMMDSIWQNRLLSQERNLQKSWNQQLLAYQDQQEEDMSHFVNNFHQEEMPELANLVQNLLNKHQQETKLMFGEAWANWQDTREDDMKIIRNEFANVYQTQDATDALLINVINQSDD